jgi:hypothetical protein
MVNQNERRRRVQWDDRRGAPCVARRRGQCLRLSRGLVACGEVITLASCLASRSASLVSLYRLTLPARNLRPRYNIAPTMAIDVLRSLLPIQSLVRWVGVSFRSFWARAAIASPYLLMQRLAGMFQRQCVEPAQELVDIDKFLVSVRG